MRCVRPALTALLAAKGGIWFGFLDFGSRAMFGFNSKSTNPLSQQVSCVQERSVVTVWRLFACCLSCVNLWKK